MSDPKFVTTPMPTFTPTADIVPKGLPRVPFGEVLAVREDGQAEVRVGSSGTIEGEAHPRDVEEERLDEIERYELDHMHTVDNRLPLNGRILLAMVREIRRRRAESSQLVDDAQPDRPCDRCGTRTATLKVEGPFVFCHDRTGCNIRRNEREERSDNLLRRVRDLTERVTEVLAVNTRIENERRKYKSLYEATKKLLTAATVDLPTSIAVVVKGEPFPISDLIREVHERNERLEADAWCNAASELRAFVRAFDAGDVKDLKTWRDRFAEVVR